MSNYFEWVNFVIYPSNPNKVLTKENRLDCSKAINLAEQNQNETNEEFNKSRKLIAELGAIVTKDQVVFDDDEFEVMEVTDYGKIAIWTKKRVWAIFNHGDAERLTYLPRHPQSSNVGT